MDESPKEIICKDEAHAIVGCAFGVLNTLGCGLLEKPYENALAVEFGLRKIPFMQQEHYNVVYKGVTVGFYIPDLVAYDKAVIDTKVIDRITDTEKGQGLNYLRISKLKVGLILNSRRPILEWQRVVL